MEQYGGLHMKIDMQKVLALMNQKKKLILSVLIAVAVLVLITVVILVSCGGEKEPNNLVNDPNDSQGGTTPGTTPDLDSVIEIKESDAFELEQTNDDHHFSMTVGNATELLYLYKYVQVKDGVDWELSLDIEFTGSSTIASKTVQLSEGENTYYILCTDDAGLFEIYKLSIYRRKLFTVSFENLTETQQIEEGGMAVLPKEKPEKTGYTFNGTWSFNFTTPITEDITIKANWKANTYTITYDANGGYVSPLTQTVTYGSDVKLAIPSRSGYEFLGWQSGSTTYADGVWETASDVNLTAMWDYSSFTVTLDPAGGTLEETTVSVRYGIAYEFPIPNRAGYVFKGWYNGDELFESTGVWNRLAGLKLTAKWETSDMGSISCTMIGNGGTILPQTQILPVGSALPTPTRKGYTFGGWFADDKLTIPVTGITVDLMEQYGSSLRLYAWWEEEGKPGEFIYELSGIYCMVTGYVSATEPYPTIPEYIGGREVIVDIKPPKNPNAGITVSPTITLTVGDAVAIQATFIPPYATDSKVLYFSTDSDCIQLGITGAVTALKPGTAVVTIQNEDGSYMKTCVLTILGKLNKNPGITVNNPSVTVEEGKQTYLDIIFVPTRVGDSTELIYTVDGEYVKVEDGLLTALKVGTTTITVKNITGEYSATIEVTVTERLPNPGAGITLDRNSITLEEGGTNKIIATFIPMFETDDTTLIYISSNPQIVTVDQSGNIKALKYGTVEITVTNSNNQFIAVCTVTATEKPDPNAGIILDKSSIVLEEGQTDKLTASFIPVFDADNLTLTFTSLDPRIVTVDKDGNIKAVRYGATVVMITNSDGKFSAICIVTVTEKPDPNAGIIFEKDEITLEEGAQGNVNATFIPVYDEDDTSLVYRSSEPDIVFVDSNGNITALKPGTAIITVRNKDGKFDAACTVVVTEKPDDNAGITLEKDEISLNEGEDGKINATFVPVYDEDDRTLSYESSDPEIVYVDNEGNLIAKKPGTVTITVRNVNGEFSKICKVTVIELPDPNAGITLDKDKITLDEGEEDSLHATFIPVYDADDITLIYESSNPEIVYVDEEGNIRALKHGTVIITVKNSDGTFSVSCEITVIELPDPNAGIVIDKEEITVQEGDKVEIPVTFIPVYDDDDTTLTYESSDPEIVYVDEEGNIVAIKYGTVIITVTNGDGTFSATCTVTVTEKADENAGITLDKQEISLEEGESGKINAIYVPVFDDDDTTLIYESSDPEIVYVDEEGNIEALKYGTVTITVTNSDGTFSAMCTVTVAEKPDQNAGITLNRSELTLYIGESFQLEAEFIPVFDNDSRLLFYSVSGSAVIVDGTGLVFAKEIGSAIITVVNLNGEFTATCVVTVSNRPNENAGITLEKEEITLEEGENGKINAVFVPVFDEDDTTLTYESSDPEIVYVDEEGNIEALKHGTVTVTVTNSDGTFSKTCTVTVTEKPNENAGITLEKEEITLEEGENGKINAVFVPVFDEDDTTLTYESSDPEIVYVDEEGNIEALKHGTVTVTVTN
ncbi:MAG: hypothetical protein E7616_02415, partial [Ruminococcaceae bacterium]|nr:hypothetical protein [Oscillospiraceae bacterium]